MYISNYTKKLFSNYIVYIMKCFNSTMIRGKNVMGINGKGFIKEDNNMSSCSINDIDKKIDVIQKKLQETKLNPIRSKLRTIKLSL